MTEAKNIEWNPLRGGVYRAIEDRGLNRETCEKFRCKVGPAGEIIYEYRLDGQVIGQHIRYPDKDFKWRYSPKHKVSKMPLYGMDLWNTGGKRLIITEGEYDAMTVSQVLGHGWPVVSLPNGVNTAEESIKTHYQWIESFDEIVLCFDMDKPGQEAAIKCAEMLPLGKVKIAKLPHKDANDCLMAGDAERLKWSVLKEASPYRPDGVVNAADVELSYDAASSIWPWPYRDLDEVLLGRSGGELCVITSGTGQGKSSFIRECIYSDIRAGHKVGILMLEEGIEDTLLDLIGLHINKPVRKILRAQALNQLRESQMLPPLPLPGGAGVTPQELERGRAELFGLGNLLALRHFGSLASNSLISKIRYMIVEGCTMIYLDHLSIVVSGHAAEDERKDIDRLMTALRSLVEETEVWMAVVSHIRKAESGRRTAEEGGRVTLGDLRGSGSIAQLADTAIALERDQQHEDSSERNRVSLRVLKDRLGGSVGADITLRYDKASGRIVADGDQQVTTSDMSADFSAAYE